MPAHVLQKQLGHKNIHTTIDTYTDVFNKYENTYHEILEEYYKTNNLLLSNMVDQKFIIQNDIKKFVSLINNSHFTEAIKNQFLEYIETVKTVYKYI